MQKSKVPNKMVSMKQIAELAGVSSATVSRALGDLPLVDIQTRKRIRELADRLQYRPNRLVRGVIRGKTPLVGMIAANSGVESVARMQHEMREALYKKGFSTITYNTHQNIALEAECLHRAVEFRVSGLIIASVNYRADERHFWELRQNGTPFVLLSSFGQSVHAPHIHWNGLKLAAQIVDHLVRDLAHRELLILAGPTESWPENLFLQQVTAELAKEGISDPDKRLIPSLWDIETGYAATQELLKSGRKFSALYCISDDLAVGAMQAIRETGRSVPGDISVMGIGDSKVGRVVTPTLTTVDTRYREVSRTAVEILLNMMESSNNTSNGATSGHVVHDCQIICRESTTARV